jgi:hypothetical protein
MQIAKLAYLALHAYIRQYWNSQIWFSNDRAVFTAFHCCYLKMTLQQYIWWFCNSHKASNRCAECIWHTIPYETTWCIAFWELFWKKKPNMVSRCIRHRRRARSLAFAKEAILLGRLPQLLLFPRSVQMTKSLVAIFRRVRKISKSFVMSVSLSVCMKLGSHCTDFDETWYISFFRKSVQKIQVSSKSDKNGRYFTWRRFGMWHLAKFFSEWEKLQTNLQRK